MTPYRPRTLTAPRSSFFLFGPRGTGKTTWVRHEYPDAHRIDLLDEALYQSYLADVGRFAGELQAVASGGWVFVDEIQRLPGLLNEVHRHIEGSGLRFILTGSSARKLKRAGVNLLGGRAVHTRMYPFLPHELGTDFDLDTVLRHGSLPVIWNADDRAAALRSYVQLYLKEEIKGEALVRNLAGFARFMPVAALFHGQTLNIASAARDAEVSRTTLAGYVEILEDTLVAFVCPRTIRSCESGNGSTRSCTGSIPDWHGRRPDASAISTRANAAPCSKAGSPPCSPATATTTERSTRCTTGRRRKRGTPRSTSSCCVTATRSPSRPRRPHASTTVTWRGSVPSLRCPACSAGFSPTRVGAACGVQMVSTSGQYPTSWKPWQPTGSGNGHSSGESVPISSISSAITATGLSSSPVSSMGS